MKSVYIGNEDEFNKIFSLFNDKKVQRTLDLKDCKNHDDLVCLMLDCGMTKEKYGKCFNSLKDALGDDGWSGFNVFYKIKNWHQYYLLNPKDAMILLNIFFTTIIEMKKLKNINYLIYLDVLPDFNDPEISEFRYLLD